MDREELIQSWTRTTFLLQDALAQMAPAAEQVCPDQIGDFEKCVEHNEFELALDMLDEIAASVNEASVPMIKAMEKAALNMGMAERAGRYRERLSRWRGKGPSESQ